MATAGMRMHGKGTLRPASSVNGSRPDALFRLFEVDQSDQVFPLLLEELVSAGFPRAVLLTTNLESGEIVPTAAARFPESLLSSLRSSLFSPGTPLISPLFTGRPEVLRKVEGFRSSIYVHPLVYASSAVCREAERLPRSECLAVANQARARKINYEEQHCSVCQMRGYVSLVAVELPKQYNDEHLRTISELLELGNRYSTRLFKIEHYYNRLADMETTIAQMGTVMQSMADPVILTDNQHRVIMQNSAAERFFKLPDEVSEGRIRAVELNNLLFSAALSSTAVSGGDTSRDLTLVDAIEGEEMLFEAVCAPTYGRDGKPVGMVTVMRDVTDLRRADEELRQNYEKLRAAEEAVRQDRDRLNLIIENVGEPIIVCDSSAKVLMLDPLAQKLFGSGRESDAMLVKNQAQLDAYITAFTFSFTDKESAQLHLWNPETKAETEYDARSGKIYDERGQVAYTITVLRDLTALRKMEQLKVERRMLEIEKFAATGRLAATIAHEVNNPMEAIKNAIYLLAGSVKPDASPVYEILKAETERVARIVRQMLGLYRNNEQVRPTSLNAIIEDTLLLLNRQLQRANVRVRTELGELPEAIVAADQIRQVLSNLIINAKDAMPDGGELRIRTRLRMEDDGIHGWIRILIGDTGTGIPPRLQRSIFEPFVTTKGEKGTGLGLWIVRGILHDHAGRISLRSRVGKGTVFAIDLPVVR